MGWKAIATWSPSLKREGSGYLESKQAACWSLLMRRKPQIQPGHHMKLLDKVAVMGGACEGGRHRSHRPAEWLSATAAKESSQMGAPDVRDVQGW